MSALSSGDAGSGMVVFDARGIIKSADKAFASILGVLDPDYLINRPLKPLIPLSLPPSFQRQVLFAKSPVRNTANIQVSVLVSKLQDGDDVYYMALVEPTLVDRGLVTITPQGTIVSCNSVLVKMFGYNDEGDLLNKNVSVLMPDPISGVHDKYVGRYFAGKTRTTKIVGHSRNIPARAKDGTIFPVSLRVERLNMGKDNVLLKGTFVRIEAQETFITLDESGCILACVHEYVLMLFGYSEQELLGKHISMILPCLESAPDEGRVDAYSDNSRIQIQDSRSDSARKRVDSRDLDVAMVDVKRRKSESHATSPIRTVSRNESQSATEPKSPDAGVPLRGLVQEAWRVSSNFSYTASMSNSWSSADSDDSSHRVKATPSGSGYFKTVALHKDGSLVPLDFRLLPFAEFDEKESATEIEKKLQNTTIEHKSGVNVQNCKLKPHLLKCYQAHIRIAPKKKPRDLDSGDFEGEKELRVEPSNLRVSLQDNGLRIGAYLITKKLLGNGTFGSVRFGVHYRTKLPVAVKILSKSELEGDMFVRTQREVEIMKGLSHPSICKLYDAVEKGGRLFLFLEYVGGGDLTAFVLERYLNAVNAGKMDCYYKVVRVVLQKVASALKYLHESGVVHRDLAAKNILIECKGDLDCTGQSRENENAGNAENSENTDTLSECGVKLIDFGLSNYAQDSLMQSTFCGTPAYASPEMLLSRPYAGTLVDVWSLGVLFYFLLCAKLPFRSTMDAVQAKYTFEGIDENIPQGAKKLLARMLAVNPSDRISVADVLNDPWVQGKE